MPQTLCINRAFIWESFQRVFHSLWLNGSKHIGHTDSCLMDFCHYEMHLKCRVTAQKIWNFINCMILFFPKSLYHFCCLMDFMIHTYKITLCFPLKVKKKKKNRYRQVNVVTCFKHPNLNLGNLFKKCINNLASFIPSP